MSCHTKVGSNPEAPPDEALAPVVFSREGVERRHQLDFWRSTCEPFNSIKQHQGAGRHHPRRRLLGAERRGC